MRQRMKPLHVVMELRLWTYETGTKQPSWTIPALVTILRMIPMSKPSRLLQFFLLQFFLRSHSEMQRPRTTLLNSRKLSRFSDRVWKNTRRSGRRS